MAMEPKKRVNCVRPTSKGFTDSPIFPPAHTACGSCSQPDTVQTSPLGNLLTTTTAPTGDGPETIAAGDFNRDGLADLVVANTETNNVSLLLNLGNGVFAPPQQLIVGSRPSGLAVADFNRDGWDDLAVTNYYSPLVSLFINTKNPAAPLSLSQSIALPETVTIGGYGSRGITVADFNQDNWPDLAVANEFSRKLALLTNNGSGATPQLSYSGAITLSGADGLVSGQFTDDNNDALYNSLDRADLAVLNFDSGQVTVLRNDGAGIFNTLGIYTVGVGAYGVTAADLNGDGRADLVTANFTANTVSVLMNLGGSFAAAVHYVAGAGPTSVVAVDLDNDGDRDLAVSNKSSRQVSILRNNGTGVFGTPDNLGVADLAGGVAFSVTAADLNHDQIADLVVASNQRSTISVLRNTLVTGSYRVQLTGVNTVSAMDFGLQPTTSAPLVTLSTTSNNLSETGGVTTVIATLSNSWGQPITVDLSYTGTAIGNVDYQASAVQILILPGQTSGSVTLTALGDNLSEAAESITVDITGVSGGAAENGTQQVNVTIVDDDPLPLVTLDLIGRTVAENGGVATVTASLSAAAGQPVTVTLAFGGTAGLGSDYSTSALQLVIPAGQTSASLLLTGLDDSSGEGNESITVDIASVSGGLENGIQRVSATISDDDAFVPPVILVDLQATAINLSENGGVAQVVALLSATSSQTVTIQLGFSGAATNSVDYSASAASITIAAGELSGSITLVGRDDLLAEGNETLAVEINSVTGATENGAQQVTLSLLDSGVDPFQIVGNNLTILGTSGNDTLIFQFISATAFSADINGTSQAFSLAQVSTIAFTGQAGNDTLLFLGSDAGVETATLSTSSMTVAGASYTFSATNLEYKYLFGDASRQRHVQRHSRHRSALSTARLIR